MIEVDSDPYSKKIDLITRLRIRAKIRREIKTRKSVQEGKPDRLADLLDEAANALEENVKRVFEYIEKNKK